MRDENNDLTSPPEVTDNSKRLPKAQTEAQNDRPLIHQSGDLLQGRQETWIEHNGEMYRLRVTSRGKLYLTK